MQGVGTTLEPDRAAAAPRRPVAARRAGAIALLAALVALGEGPRAATIGSALVPHRAIYSMGRHHESSSTDVTDVKGRMEINFEASCDGWRIEQFMGFRLFSERGESIEHLAHLSGWETAGGRDYWFNTRSYENRELLEEVGGVARLRPGGDGEAQFRRPTEYSRPLPRGTLFPAAHIRELIAAARRGVRSFLRTVFDGSTEEAPFEVSAFIGPEVPRETLRPAPLVGLRAWPMRLAYYKLEAMEPTAEFEMSVVLFENGVAGDMVYNYGDLSIDVELREVEVLAAPRCD